MHKVIDRYFQFCGPEFIQLPERVRRLAFPRTRMGEFFRIDCFLKNYVGTHEWQFRYICGKYSYVRRTKQGIKTRTLWGISRYH
jgi:hypothetical protein